MPVQSDAECASEARPSHPGVIFANTGAVALWRQWAFPRSTPATSTPSWRVTASTLSSASSTALATILMFVFIDPQVSVMTDDVIEGKYPKPQFQPGRRVAGRQPRQPPARCWHRLLIVPAADADRGTRQPAHQRGESPAGVVGRRSRRSRLAAFQ